MIYVGIDPGPEKSAYVVTDDYKPMYCSKVENGYLRELLINANISDGIIGEFVIEVPVCRKWSGQDICNTAIWTGIFLSSWPDFQGALKNQITRQAVRMHTVGKKATDASIRKYLVERFDPEAFQPTKSGVLKDQGSEWFSGFADDIWQAYALLVTFIDKKMGRK